MKYTGEGRDPYLDPDADILKNYLGVKDKDTLEKVESGFSFLRMQEMKDSPIDGKFDLAHMREIHKRLFSDVYEWAGQIRQVDISKDSTRFAHANFIESAARKIFDQLAKEDHLRGLDADAFSQRAGYYLGEINALHPFREGNGRVQREFIGQIASKAGYHISWSAVSRSEMTCASIEAYNGNFDRMARLIRENLTNQGDDK